MLGLVLLSSQPARAQSVPSTSFGIGAVKVPGDTKRKTGKGLAFGRSVFHAGLSLEGGWDSNVFYDDADEYPASSGYIRVVPELTLGSRPVGKGKKPGFLYFLSAGMDYVHAVADVVRRTFTFGLNLRIGALAGLLEGDCEFHYSHLFRGYIPFARFPGTFVPVTFELFQSLVFPSVEPSAKACR